MTVLCNRCGLLRKDNDEDIDKLIEQLEQMGVYKKPAKKIDDKKDDVRGYLNEVKDKIKNIRKSIRGTGKNLCNICLLPCDSTCIDGAHKACIDAVEEFNAGSRVMLKRKFERHVQNVLDNSTLSMKIVDTEKGKDYYALITLVNNSEEEFKREYQNFKNEMSQFNNKKPLGFWERFPKLSIILWYDMYANRR